MLNLSVKALLGKDKQAWRAVEPGVRKELADYLDARGIWMDLDTFAESIRYFFDESQGHHDRLAFRDAIAECLNLDMKKSGDRDTLWHLIANGRRVHRKERSKWKSEEIDPPLEHLLLYFPSMGTNRKPPSLDNGISRVQTGIARTLIYISVFPPAAKGGGGTDAEPESVKQCREKLRRHVRYRRHSDLNQHAIDGVRELYPTTLWLDAHKVGELRSLVESERLPQWAASFVLFKFATYADIPPDDNKVKNNPCKWLWDDSHPQHDAFWSVNNGRA